MQVLVIGLGLVLIAAGLYFAIGGLGQESAGGGARSITLQGPAWLILVAMGAGLVLLPVFVDFDDPSPEVGVDVGGGDETEERDDADDAGVDTTTTTSTTSTTTSSTTTEPAPSALEVTSVRASSTKSADRLRCEQIEVGYDPGRLVDGDAQTGWSPDQDDGTGAWIELDFGREVDLRRVGLSPGYLRFGQRKELDCAVASSFDFNRFVVSVRYSFDDGSTVDHHFDRRAEIQYLDVEVRTSSVRITILDTDLPSNADNDTIISEVEFEGIT